MYPLIGFLILPLIIIVAQLMKIHPSGGFYTFGAQEIHPYAGFISAWSYFTGKLASAMLMIHVAMLLCQYIIPSLGAINIFVLDAVVLSLLFFSTPKTCVPVVVYKWAFYSSNSFRYYLYC